MELDKKIQRFLKYVKDHQLRFPISGINFERCLMEYFNVRDSFIPESCLE